MGSGNVAGAHKNNDARVAEERRKAAEAKHEGQLRGGEVTRLCGNVATKPPAPTMPTSAPASAPATSAPPAPPKPSPPPKPAPVIEAQKARAALAVEAGVSPRSMQKALTLQARAPQKFEAVAKGVESGNQAYRQVQRDEARARVLSAHRKLREAAARESPE